jgi:hypothetical protein
MNKTPVLRNNYPALEKARTGQRAFFRGKTGKSGEFSPWHGPCKGMHNL